MRRLILFIALWLFTNTTAHAEYSGVGIFTGNDLYTVCSSSISYDQKVCNYYVAGAASATTFSPSLEKNEIVPGPYCLPAHLQLQQIVDIFKNELKSHPEDRDKDASYLLIRQLMKFYPCR